MRRPSLDQLDTAQSRERCHSGHSMTAMEKFFIHKCTLLDMLKRFYIRIREACESWCRKAVSLTCPGCSQAVWYLACWHSSLTLSYLGKWLDCWIFLLESSFLRSNFLWQKGKSFFCEKGSEMTFAETCLFFFLPCHMTPRSPGSKKLVSRGKTTGTPQFTSPLQKITSWELWGREVRGGRVISSKIIHFKTMGRNV